MITAAQIEMAYAAVNFMDDVRTLYSQASALLTKIQNYNTSADPGFNAAVDQVWTATEVIRVLALETDLSAIVTTLEGSYDDIIHPV